VLDRLWLAGGPGPRAALNLGGIANVSVVQPDGTTLAWDTGPANCLLDVAAGRATGGAVGYDRDGELARSGRVDPGLLDRLLDHPHYRATPPVSTGRETFSADYLTGVLAAAGDTEWPDVLATLVELTARTVADAVLPHHPVEVVASGGGVRNPALMAALRRHLRDVPLRTSDELGLPADGKEAVLWALLGFLTWHGVPVSTGPHPPRVLGRITPGRTGLVLPPPVPPPRGLRLVRTRTVPKETVS
jgi:anhydro-N-acetylmuramic acid kinase